MAEGEGSDVSHDTSAKHFCEDGQSLSSPLGQGWEHLKASRKSIPQNFVLGGAHSTFVKQSCPGGHSELTPDGQGVRQREAEGKPEPQKLREREYGMMRKRRRKDFGKE